jgi:hypothetical protein
LLPLLDTLHCNSVFTRPTEQHPMSSPLDDDEDEKCCGSTARTACTLPLGRAGANPQSGSSSHPAEERVEIA